MYKSHRNLFNSVRFGIQNVVILLLRANQRTSGRASECMLKYEHEHNDLFYTHIKTRAQHLNLSFVSKHLRLCCRFSFSRWPSSVQLKLDLNCTLFCSRTYTQHMSCRSNGVRNHLSPNLWFSLAFLCFAFFSDFFSYFINCSVCSRGAQTHSQFQKHFMHVFFLLCNELFSCCVVVCPTFFRTHH